jgi:DNA polymerase-3 subunit gamma/tau
LDSLADVADRPDAATAFNDEKVKPAGEGLDLLREAIFRALDERGHQTAAALMTAGNWQLEGDTVQVQVAVKKLMLGLVMNPEAEKIARGVMTQQGFAPKLRVFPGDGSAAQSSGTQPNSAVQGSIQETALENPLVKKAQELFRAEVRSILDLRDKDSRDKR